MLVISRKIGEKVIIGVDGEIKVEVIRINRQGDVRLGFHAPSEVPVHREEVYEAIQQERRKLTSGPG